MSSCHVLGLGSAHIDLFIPVDDLIFSRYASPESRLIDVKVFNAIVEAQREFQKIVPGGCAANTIRGLANLGASCAFLSCVGKDEWGALFLKNLKKLGIQSHVSVVPEFSTILLICLVNPAGEKRIIYPDTKEPHTFFKEEHFKNIDLVHIDAFQFEIGNDLEQAAQMAPKISFNLGNAQIAAQYKEKILPYLQNHADIVFGNENEIEALTGLSSEKGCLKLQQFCPLVVMTQGSKGCLIVHENGCFTVPAFPAKAIDSTGAGDFFAGGFLYGYMKGDPLVRCATIGNLLGAAIVEVLGTEIPEKKWKSLRRQLH